YGWVWVPDTTWGPSWVDWRFGGGYVGWAPLPPYGVNVVFDSYSPHWCFVEAPFFTRPHVWSYAVPFERVHYAYSVSAPIRTQVTYGRARWYSGPAPTHIATAVGRPIAPVHVAPPRPGVVTPVRAAAPSAIRAAPV